MRVLIAAIADHAWVEQGCLSLCRTFDAVNADKFPYILPRMSIACRLLFRRSEAGTHKLNVSLADSDGNKLMNSDVNIDFSPPQNPVSEASFAFAINGQNINFPKAGDYVVDILVDGRVEASIPLSIRERKPPLDIPDRI